MSKKISRREFLKKSAVSLAAISIPNVSLPGFAFAAEDGPRAMVVVQLTGGMDPFLAFPYTSDVSQLRGNAARINPNLITKVIQSGTATSPGLGIHPGLSDLEPYFSTMKVIMQTGNAYSRAPDRSHEIAQLYMSTGGYGDHDRRVGWTARLFDQGFSLRGFNGVTASYNCETCKLPPIVTTNYEELNIGNTPMQLNGITNDMAIRNSKHVEKVLENLSGYKPRSASDGPNSDPIGMTPSRQIGTVEEYYRKSQRNMFHALDAIAGRNGIVGTLSPIYRTSRYSAYEVIPPQIPSYYNIAHKQLALQFRNIAQTLKEMKAKNDNSRIIFVLQLDGFDLHDNWITRGDTLMYSLGKSLKIFLDDLKDPAQNLYDSTAVFFCTEFGRTILASTGGAGTDHGIGYPSFVIGGKVNGGVHGPVYNVQDLNLFARTKGNAWPREVAQERIIAEILSTHLKIDPRLAFPGDFLDNIPQASGLNLFRA